MELLAWIWPKTNYILVCLERLWLDYAHMGSLAEFQSWLLHFATISCPMVPFVYCFEGCTCIMPIWALWIGFAHTILFVTNVLCPKGYTWIKPRRMYCTRPRGLWLEFNHIFCNLHTVHCMSHECLWLGFGHKWFHWYLPWSVRLVWGIPSCTCILERRHAHELRMCMLQDFINLIWRSWRFGCPT